jgi:hypothetical protein
MDIRDISLHFISIIIQYILIIILVDVMGAKNVLVSADCFRMV